MKRLLIANRGEIACRIIRTCRDLGIETVAVASKIEADSAWMQQADFGVVIGEASPQESYLKGQTLIDVARRYQVDAIHPGYGFLSENPEFADLCRTNGFIFIGPSAQSIRDMGSKSTAKSIAHECGIPIISGYVGEDQSLAILKKEASHIGYPLLIKATYGGGGKGMRLVDCPEEFEMALAGCQREAQGAFGNPTVMLEKYIPNPRHIEIQVFGDQHGTVLGLSERDCSLQRRHQKIIEEAPADGLPEDLRTHLQEAALKVARAVQYEGAGTVEFLVDSSGHFFFLEMNTRLQVEHPVTEEVLGLDLVALQIHVAQGESLSSVQEDLMPQGHALEVRLYAEDPDNGFLPSTGRLNRFTLPETCRVETGYREGDFVTPYYDPMLAKIIVWGENRQAAYTHLREALSQIHVDGVKTNASFLKRLAQSPDVVNTYPDVTYIDRLTTAAESECLSVPSLQYALACLWLYTQQEQEASKTLGTPWDIADGWRVNDYPTVTYHFWENGQDIRARLQCYAPQDFVISIGANVIRLQKPRTTPTSLWCLQDDCSIKVSVLSHGNEIIVMVGNEQWVVHLKTKDHLDLGDNQTQSHLNAPMPGRIISVMVQEGESVERGHPLLILEAMKMEHTIRAPYDGTVDRIHFASGDFVEEGAELAQLSAA